jgi:hypothetical protein
LRPFLLCCPTEFQNETEMSKDTSLCLCLYHYPLSKNHIPSLCYFVKILASHWGAGGFTLYILIGIKFILLPHPQFPLLYKIVTFSFLEIIRSVCGAACFITESCIKFQNCRTHCSLFPDR